MENYNNNETVTISLERYEELKGQLRELKSRYEGLKECFDIFPSSTNAFDFNRTWFIKTDTAKEQIEKVAVCLGYKCADNAEQDK